MFVILVFTEVAAGTGGLRAADLQQAGKDFWLMSVGVGGRAAGMGNAQCAAVTDGSAAYWNPAAMLFNRRVEITSMQAKLASDTDVYTLASVVQSGDAGRRATSAWGVFWSNASAESIPKTTETGSVSPTTDVRPTDYFSYSAHVLGVSMASWLAPNVSVGLTVAGSYQNFSLMGHGTGVGVSVTPGLMWMLGPDLAIGGIVRDVANANWWDTGTTESVLPEIRFGASYAPYPSVVVAGEVRQFVDSRYAMTFHAGIEYRLWSIIRLRLGMDHDRFSGGCGVYIGNFDVQYAYVGDISEGIGDSHRVSIGFGI